MTETLKGLLDKLRTDIVELRELSDLLSERYAIVKMAKDQFSELVK